MDEICPVNISAANMRTYNKHLADVVILTANKRFLLQKRYSERRPGVEIVTLFGGHVEEGETLLEAAARELQEETGGSASPDDLVAVGALTESWTNHTELVHVWFWHDRRGTITGCYEREAIEFASLEDAMRHPGLMDYAKWALLECKRRELLPR